MPRTGIEPIPRRLQQRALPFELSRLYILKTIGGKANRTPNSYVQGKDITNYTMPP